MAAVTTEAEVCNLALGLIGHRQFIDDLGEDSPEGEACTVYFKTVRNTLLAAFDWRFASQVATLALTTEARDGWGFCYTLPANCLEPREIVTGLRVYGAGEAVPFDKVLNDAAMGFLLCTDQEDAVLRYTVELSRVALWTPGFVDAVAAELAVRLVGALPVKPELMPMLKQGARAALLHAAATDANTAVRDPRPDAEWIRAR